MRAAALAALFLALPAVAAADPPATAAPAADPPAKALAGALPFQDSKEVNRVFLDLAPDGEKRRLRVLLDTGANYVIFSPQAAKDAGVRPRRMKDTDYRRKTRLGRPLLFWVDTSYSDSRTETGWNYGLLGGNFLEHFVLELDIPGRTVRFWDVEKYSVPKSVSADDEAVIPMHLNSRRPVIDVTVNGVTIPVMVDTGAPDGLAVSGDQAEAMGLEPFPDAEFSWGGTVGGTTARLADAASVKIGPFTLEHVPVFVEPHGFYNLGARGGGMLGYDLLSEFVVRFDYGTGRVWLKHKDPQRRLLSYDYAAMREAAVLLAPAEDHTAEVWGVLPDGPAAARGVRTGDRLAGAAPARVLAESLRDGKEITVARQQGDARVDTVLPPRDVSARP